MDTREIEERRYGAIQALRAVVECLKETNPQNIFAVGKSDQFVNEDKIKNISNRWAEKAADVLMKALELADAVGNDGLELFKHHEIGK